MTGAATGDPLRVAGIGAGYFSQFHYDAWKAMSGAELLAVADRDLGKAAQVGVTAFDDVDAMLREVAPDIVDIVTPPETHLDMIRSALGRSVKAIICQKPFCGELAQAEQATALAEAAGVPLIVHENFRFQPWYRILQREMAAGRIGDVLQVTFRLRPGDGQGPEAYLDRQPYFQQMPRFLVHETAVHWIDTFRFLLGEPDEVYADLRRLNPNIRGEDAGYFIYGYRDGRRALFDGNRLLDHAAENQRRTMGECFVEGTEGEMRLLGDGSLSFRARRALAWESLAPPPDAAGFGGGCVAALQAHVVAALLEGTPLENTARSYLRNIRIELALYDSAESGQRTDIGP
jgi:predicted dehydrogenase